MADEDRPADIGDFQVTNGHSRTETFGNWPPPGPPLPPSGGGGDGLPSRVARLEADIAHLAGDVTDLKRTGAALSGSVAEVRTDVAVIKERLSHLPTKTHTVTTAIAIVGAGALLYGFGPQVQSFVQSIIAHHP